MRTCPIDVDPDYVVRDVEGRVLPLEESISYLARSRDAWIKAARFARGCMEQGIEVEFYRYQIGVRVGLARECQHRLLKVRRQRRKVGVQATLFGDVS